jgi:hypothetical protein
MFVKNLVDTLRHLAPQARVALASGETPSIVMAEEWRVDARGIESDMPDGCLEFFNVETEARHRASELASAGYRFVDCEKVKVLVVGRHLV